MNVFYCNTPIDRSSAVSNLNNQYGAYGIIKEHDMYLKQQEFHAWLREVKNANREALTKAQVR